MSSLHAAIALTFAFFFALQSSAVLAHNIVGAVFVEGNRVEGEIGFSNGDMAEAGAAVQLRSIEGDVLAETVTDDAGVFVFELDSVADFQVTANLGQGHAITLDVLAEDIQLPSAELASIARTKTALPTDSVDETRASTITVDRALLREIVDASVAQRVKPLQRELIALRNATRLSDILGGVGVIFGVFGAVAFWLANRRQREAGVSSSQARD